MGVPLGHPFFGNQYTNGGYITGAFKYIPKIAEKVVEYSSKLVSDEIGKGAAKMVTRQKPKNLCLNGLDIKGSNKTILIGVAIALATAGGIYFAYKNISKRIKAKKDALQFIELSNVGTCMHCGEPLSGSIYVPESETNSYKACIICKKCGEKNIAWYPDGNDSLD